MLHENSLLPENHYFEIAFYWKRFYYSNKNNYSNKNIIIFNFVFRLYENLNFLIFVDCNIIENRSVNVNNFAATLQNSIEKHSSD